MWHERVLLLLFGAKKNALSPRAFLLLLSAFRAGELPPSAIFLAGKVPPSTTFRAGASIEQISALS